MSVQIRTDRRPGAKKIKLKRIPKSTAATREKQTLSSMTRCRRIEQEDQRNLSAAAERAGLPNDLQRRCRLELRRIDSLRPSKHHIHKIDTQHVQNVMTSLLRNGMVQPPIVTGDIIVDGHIKIRALIELGEHEVVCLIIDDLDEADIARIALALDSLAKDAELDLDTLRIIVNDVIPLEDLEFTYLADEVLDILFLGDDEVGSGPGEDVPEPRPNPITRLGDNWTLGGNRIVCASATDPASYEALMGDERAAAVLTDEPYNVRIANNVSGQSHHREFVEGSGEKTSDQFFDFNQSWMRLSESYCIKGAAIATFIDWRSIEFVLRAGRELGLKLINLAIWDKQSGSMGSYLRSAHEMFPIFCNADALATNNVQLGRHGRDRTNVWRYAGANRRGSSAAAFLKDHPTPKNLEMIIDLILDVTKRGDIVLEPFLGSGTTLAAAERCHRRCFALELDPIYVDVSIRRWQEMTGEDAVHVETGLTFKELEVIRLREGAAEGGSDE